MHVVDPSDFFRRFYGRDVEIHNDWLLATSHEHTFERLVSAGVDLLMRHIRRNVDEVARPGFSSEFEMIPPTHSRLALDHVDDAFKFSVVMSPGLCIRVNAYSPCPKLRCAGPRVSDRSRSVHPRSLRGVRIEFASANNADSVVFPAGILVGHNWILCQPAAAQQASSHPLLKRRLVIYFLTAMEKVLKVFRSFEEADQSDDEYYASLTPQERVDILLDMIAAYRESLGETSERLERVYRVIELSES
jgi:hypothetical protein